MVDSRLKPWLLEINVAPSLSSSSPYDKQVKTGLLCDTLHLVGFKVFDRKKVAETTKERPRVFRGSPMKKEEMSLLTPVK